MIQLPDDAKLIGYLKTGAFSFSPVYSSMSAGFQGTEEEFLQAGIAYRYIQIDRFTRRVRTAAQSKGDSTMLTEKMKRATAQWSRGSTARMQAMNILADRMMEVNSERAHMLLVHALVHLMSEHTVHNVTAA